MHFRFFVAILLLLGAAACESQVTEEQVIDPASENIGSTRHQPEQMDAGNLEVEPGVEIYFERVGDGPEVVLITGGMYLREEFAVLADPMRTLVFLDQRGRGRSSHIVDPNLLGVEQEVSDLETVRAHFDVEKIALIGWSYEGGVAMRYALRHSERVTRVILIGPISPRNTPYRAQSQATLAARRDSAVVDELGTLLEAVSAGGGPEQRRAYWHLFHKAFMFNPDIELRFRSDYYTLQNELPDYAFPVQMAAIYSSLGDWDWRTELEGLEVPVLVVQGDYDFLPLAGAQEWVATLPNAQLRIVSQAGHLPWAENPEAVFPAIDLFLSGEVVEQ